MTEMEIISENFGKIGAELAKNYKAIEDKIKTKSEFTENEVAKQFIFHKWYQITYVFENIKNCSIYMNSFKYYPKISKTHHLKFMFSVYINEVYILQLRLETFKKHLYRLLKKERQDKVLIKLISELDKIIKFIKNSLKGIINTRGNSVHIESFDSKDISDVEGEEFIIELQEELSKYKPALKYKIKLLKNKYIKTIKENNEVIEKLLNVYMRKVNEILFTNNYIDKIIYINLNNHTEGRTKKGKINN